MPSTDLVIRNMASTSPQTLSHLWLAGGGGGGSLEIGIYIKCTYYTGITFCNRSQKPPVWLRCIFYCDISGNCESRQLFCVRVHQNYKSFKRGSLLNCLLRFYAIEIKIIQTQSQKVVFLLSYDKDCFSCQRCYCDILRN